MTPKRVNIKDVESKEPRGFKQFPKGARHLLHPKLAIADEIECEFLYETGDRFFVIDYSKSDDGKYQKQLITNKIDTVVETIEEFLQEG
jgi:hypothetical protein